MIFFFLLRETGYDWPKAREIFYSLYPPGTTVKSFDLRGEGFGRRDYHY